MRLPHRWLLLLFLWLLSASPAGHAEDILALTSATESYNPAQQLRYFIDDSNSMTLDTLPAEEDRWQALQARHLNLGYVAPPIWIKWRMQRSAPLPMDWYLVIHYAMLDHIDVYLRESGTTAPQMHLTLGDHLPFKQRPLVHPEFITPLTLNSDQPYEVVLRIQSSGSIQVPISVENPVFFWEQDRFRAMLEAGSYLICLVMALYNFVLYLFLRDKSYLFYVLYIVFLMVGLGAIRGWSYQYLWPETPQVQDWAVILGTLLGAASALAFATSFMRLQQIAPRMHYVVSSMAVLCLITAGIGVFLKYHTAVQLAVGLTLTFSVAMAGIALGIWYKTRSRQAALYSMSWMFLLIGASLYMGNKFGLFPVNFVTDEGLRVGALFEIVFLSLALADRVNQDRAATEAAQRKMIELQASMNSELEKQVKTRTQELEYLNQLLHQSSITDALTSTANRRHFDDMLDKEYRRAIREGLPLALLMVDLDHFKRINDTWGHPVGDVCLQEAARILLSTIKRPPDMVARYGGEEFAVLLPNTPIEGALVVAEQIQEKLRALMISVSNGQQVRVTASIGAASQYPQIGDDHATLTQAADTALYAAKHGGRDRVIAAPAGGTSGIAKQA